MAKQWNEVECKQCKKPIRADALKCPYCLTEYSTVEAGGRKQQNDSENRETLKGCFVLAVIAVGAWWWFFSGDDKAEETKPAATAESAKSAPQEPSEKEKAAAALKVMGGEGALCEKAFATMMAKGQTDISKFENAKIVIAQCGYAAKQIRKAAGFSGEPPKEITISHCLTVYASARDAAKLVQQKAEFATLLTSQEIELRDHLEFVRESIPLCKASQERKI